MNDPGAAAPPAWRFLISPKWLGWHAFAVVAVWGMLWLGDWQFHRAMGGNALSWAYTFEWPLFAVFGVVFWAKTIRDEFRIRRGEVVSEAESVELPAGMGTAQSTSTDIEVYDPELAEYNKYLARLNAEVKRHGKWHGLR